MAPAGPDTIARLPAAQADPWGSLGGSDFAKRAQRAGFKDLSQYEKFRETRGGENTLGRLYDQAQGGGGEVEGQAPENTLATRPAAMPVDYDRQPTRTPMPYPAPAPPGAGPPDLDNALAIADGNNMGAQFSRKPAVAPVRPGIPELSAPMEANPGMENITGPGLTASPLGGLPQGMPPGGAVSPALNGRPAFSQVNPVAIQSILQRIMAGGGGAGGGGARPIAGALFGGNRPAF